MLRLVKALAVVLAVPLVCAALADSARGTLDHRWQVSLRRPFLLRRQMPDERLIARYSLQNLCADARSAATVRPCRPYGLFTSMRLVALLTAALGLIFLGGLALFGRASRDRRRLVRCFRPALYTTVGGLVILMLAHGALGIAGVYLLGEVIEGWPSFVVFGMVVAAFLGALSMTQVALMLARPVRVTTVSRLLDPASHPRLAAVLAEVAAAVGSRVPQRVAASLSPGCFLSEARVTTLDGVAPPRSVYLSLPLARILSVAELKGLLAHEFAHFRRGDEEEASARFYAVHAGVVRTIQALRSQATGLRSLVTLPALWVLTSFLHWLALPDASDARARELAADVAAADLVGRATLASALLKAHAFAPGWDAVSQAMDHAVAEGTQYINSAELFAQAVAASSSPERLSVVGDHALRHPTDVLPPLAERLAALGVRPSDALAAALDTQPSTPAISLFDNHELLERELSEVEHRILAMARDRRG